MMEGFKLYYDEEGDILYLAREGKEEEMAEITPGINVELDKSGMLIGVEVFKASYMFKDIIKAMEKRFQVA